jgi:hemerythrin-like metal-binding protein
MISSTWQKQLETGNPAIDLQHRTLFDTLSRLREALEKGQGEQELKRTLDFLKAYSAIHFRAEEDLMAHHGYSESVTHREWHQRFALQIKAMAEDTAGDPEVRGEEVVRFLERWLADHILQEDRRMVAEIERREIPV